MNKALIGAVSIVVVVLGYIILHNSSYTKHKEQYNDSLTVDSLIFTFDVENYYNYIKSIGIKYPDVVLAQAILESGYFTAPEAKKRNNYLGMMHSNRGYSKSVYGRQASYNSWQESLHDYKEWQYKYAWHLTSQEEYILYLQKVYATDMYYKRKITSILKELK